MNQGSLFEDTGEVVNGAYGQSAPWSRPGTSKRAAETIKPSLNELQTRVLAAIRDCRDYGATDEELQASLGMNPSTERPRRGELESQGLILDSGSKRKTKSGRPAIVWVAVEYGKGKGM